MKQFQTNLINSIFKADLLISNRKSSKQSLDLDSFNKVISSIKQLVKILNYNERLPIFLICQNKQYSTLIKKYIIARNLNIFLISYKVAVTLKVAAIFFLIDCEDSNLLSSKIQQQSNSIIYLVEKNNKNKKYFGEYIMDLDIICIKQILFILTIIKKVKNTYENI